MNIITHTIKGSDGFTAYVLTDYGRGKFGLDNIEDAIHVWLTEAAYAEVLTAVRNRNDPLQAAKDAENAALEELAKEYNYLPANYPSIVARRVAEQSHIDQADETGLGAFGTN